MVIKRWVILVGYELTGSLVSPRCCLLLSHKLDLNSLHPSHSMATSKTPICPL